MRYLKYFNYIFTGLLLLVGCEMENNPVEILSFSASDSVAVSGEGIMPVSYTHLTLPTKRIV